MGGGTALPTLFSYPRATRGTHRNQHWHKPTWIMPGRAPTARQRPLDRAERHPRQASKLSHGRQPHTRECGTARQGRSRERAPCHATALGHRATSAKRTRAREQSPRRQPRRSSQQPNVGHVGNPTRSEANKKPKLPLSVGHAGSHPAKRRRAESTGDKRSRSPGLKRRSRPARA